jgi:hypothetical protein
MSCICEIMEKKWEYSETVYDVSIIYRHVDGLCLSQE